MKQNNDLEKLESAKPNLQLHQNFMDNFQILFFGDSQTGKSTLANLMTNESYYNFLRNQHAVSPIAKLSSVEKTKGCEIHAVIRNKFITEDQVQQDDKKNALLAKLPHAKDNLNRSQSFNNQYTVKIYDITGDKTQRSFIDIYLSRFYTQINLLLFCFDVTNLRTLDNFSKWLNQLKNEQQSGQINNSQNQHSLSSQNGLLNSTVQIAEENEFITQYENYRGIPQETLSQLSIIFVGLKMDRLSDSVIPIVKRAIIKQVLQTLSFILSVQVSELFECEEGENVFLLSTVQLNQYHSEFVRLDNCIEKIYQNCDVNSQKLKYNIQLHQLENNNLYFPFGRKGQNNCNSRISRFKTYTSNLIRRLCCKKQKQ